MTAAQAMETDGPMAERHGFVTRGIHWLSAGLIAFGYLRGVEDLSSLSDPLVFWVEVGLAALLGAVFVLRALWTRHAGPTRLPAAAPLWEHVASRAVHRGLYACVFGIVLTGFGIALGYSVPLFGGVFLGAMLGLHEAVLAVFPVVLAAHVLGAIWHKLIRRDGVLESMTGRLPF